MLSGLAITAPPLGWDAEHAATQSVGIRWTQNAGIAKEQTVIIKESEIESYLGMEIDGWKGSLTIQQSRLWSIAAGILMKARGEIAVAVEDTSFVGPFRYGIPQDILGFIVSSAIYIKAVPSLGKAYVLLRNNEMRFWHYGLSAVSAGHEEWSRTEVLLIGNTIAYNREAGVYLVGDAQAELRENKIEDNKYGVELFMPPCVPINPSNILAFRGMVKGQENVIKNNKAGDLCPADYPWPPGFRK
jgi:parallel beta-helix repeat protein